MQIPLEISCTIVEVIPDILLDFVFTKRKNARKISKSMANSSAKNAIKQDIQDVIIIILHAGSAKLQTFHCLLVQ